MKPPPMHRVHIERHAVGHWLVPERTLKVPALSCGHAREVAVGLVHSEIGVAPWRPWARVSVTHATAEAVGSRDVPALRLWFEQRAAGDSKQRGDEARKLIESVFGGDDAR